MTDIVINAATAAADPTQLTTAEATAPAPKPVDNRTRGEKLVDKIEAIKKRIATDTASLVSLEQQLASVDALDNVKEGHSIHARVGRGETSRVVIATIIAFSTAPNGDRRTKIYYGEGFDATTEVIQDSQIVGLYNPATEAVAS